MLIAKIIFITFYGMDLLLAAHMHGKPKSGTVNFWVTLAGSGMGIGLLWAGGFFE